MSRKESWTGRRKLLHPVMVVLTTFALAACSVSVNPPQVSSSAVSTQTSVAYTPMVAAPSATASAVATAAGSTATTTVTATAASATAAVIPATGQQPVEVTGTFTYT